MRDYKIAYPLLYTNESPRKYFYRVYITSGGTRAIVFYQQQVGISPTIRRVLKAGKWWMFNACENKVYLSLRSGDLPQGIGRDVNYAGYVERARYFINPGSFQDNLRYGKNFLKHSRRDYKKYIYELRKARAKYKKLYGWYINGSFYQRYNKYIKGALARIRLHSYLVDADFGFRHNVNGMLYEEQYMGNLTRSLISNTYHKSVLGQIEYSLTVSKLSPAEFIIESGKTYAEKLALKYRNAFCVNDAEWEQIRTDAISKLTDYERETYAK